MTARCPRAFGFTGPSGSGKTTLIERLILHLRSEGVRVSAIKHTHHGFDLEQRGKDSHRFREAGCNEVMLVGDARMVVMTEFTAAGEPSFEDLLSRLRPVDLVLVEGFRELDIPKLEVFRTALGQAPRWPGNRSVCAVARDQPLACSLPQFDLDDIEAIAAFVLARSAVCGSVPPRADTVRMLSAQG